MLLLAAFWIPQHKWPLPAQDALGILKRRFLLCGLLLALLPLGFALHNMRSKRQMCMQPMHACVRFHFASKLHCMLCLVIYLLTTTSILPFILGSCVTPWLISLARTPGGILHANSDETSSVVKYSKHLRKMSHTYLLLGQV